MFSFFFKSGRVDPDLSFLGADMHSHLLPGIDDGLQTIEESIEFIRELNQLGYSKLICSPHILADLYPNTPKTILPKLKLVQDALKIAGIPVEIQAAAEYMTDHPFTQKLENSKKEDFLSIGGEFLLIEMSYLLPTPNIEKTIFDLQIKGLEPIMAPPERYSYFHNQFQQYKRLKELGCKLQVNLLSLTGGYGPEVKKTAEKLIKAGMVDFLGTDMHHIGHLNMLKDLATKKDFYSLVADCNLLNKSLL